MKTIDLINDLEHHHAFCRILLNCSLRSPAKYHERGKMVIAEIDEVSPSNHVLAVGADRFGVYRGYYTVV